MPIALAQAEIEIIANFDRLDDSIKGELSARLKAVTREAARAFDAIEEDAKRAARGVDVLGQALREAASHAHQLDGVRIEIAGLEAMAADVRQTSENVERLTRVLTGANAEIEQIVRASGGLNVVEEEFQDIARTANLAEQQIEQAGRALRTLNTGGSLGRVHSELQGVSRGITEAAISARTAESQFRAFNRAGNTLRFTLFNLRAVAGLAGAALAVNLGRNIFEGASSFQTIRVGLEETIKDILKFNGEAGDAVAITGDLFTQLEQTAKATPFNLVDLAEGTRRLFAFSDSIGLAGDSVQETFENSQRALLALSGTLTALGQGSDAMKPLIKAIGDVGARGRITGEEVRQFANALPGFNVLQEVSLGLREMGFELDGTGSSAADFTAAGADAADIVLALISRMEKFPGAAGALRAQAESIAGVFERISETVTIAGAKGFQPLIDFFNVEFAVAIDDAISGPLQEFGEAISQAVIENTDIGIEAVETFIETFTALVESLAPSLGAAVAALTNMADAFMIVLDAAGPLFDGLELTLDVIAGIDPIIIALAGGVLALSLAFDKLTISSIAAAAGVSTAAAASVTGVSKVNLLAISVERLNAALIRSSALGLKSFVSSFATVAASAGGIAGAIGGVQDLIDGSELSAGELADAVKDVRKQILALDKRDVQNSLNDLRENLAGTVSDFGQGSDFLGVGGFISLGIDRLPFVSTSLGNAGRAAEVATAQLAELDMIALELSGTMGDLAGFLLDDTGFQLKTDELRQLVDLLGIDLRDGAGAAKLAILDAAGGFDSFGQFLDANGIGVSLDRIRDKVEEIGQAWRDAASDLESYFNKERAKTDPFFGLLQGFAEIPKLVADGNKLLNDGIPEVDQLPDYLGYLANVDSVVAGIEDAAASLLASGGTLDDFRNRLRFLTDSIGLPADFADKLVPQNASIDDVLANIAPMVRQFFGALETETGVVLPQFVDGVLGGMGAAVESKVAEELAATNLQRIIDNNLSKGLGNQVGGAIIDPNEMARILEHNLGGAANDADLDTPGQAIGDGLLGGIGKALNRLPGKLNLWMQDAADAINSFWQIASPSKVTEGMGTAIGDGLAVGIDASMMQLPATISTALDGITPAVKAEFTQLGDAMIDGLVAGLNNGAAEVAAAARRVARDAETAIRNRLRIQSPSKVTTELGGYFTEGLAQGIAGSVGSVISASNGLSKSMTDALAGATATLPPISTPSMHSLTAALDLDLPSDLGTVSATVDLDLADALEAFERLDVQGPSLPRPEAFPNITPGSIAAGGGAHTTTVSNSKQVIFDGGVTVNQAASDLTGDHVMRQLSERIMTKAGL